MAGRKGPVRSKQRPDLFARTLAQYQALEKRFVVELPRGPASLLPRLRADLRRIRRVIRHVRQGRAGLQAIARQRLERDGL